MVARIVRTGTGCRVGRVEREVTRALVPTGAVVNRLSATDLVTPPRADDPAVGQGRSMTAPGSAEPQPRDIAVEQETPELEAELEAQSSGEPEPTGDES